jgi:hypothetical protein
LSDTLRIGLLLPGDGDGRADTESVRRGVELGIEEASRTSALFGLVMEVEAERVGTDNGTMRAARRLADRPVSAMIAAIDDRSCGELARLAVERRILLLHLDCGTDAARRDACHAFSFYVRPTAVTMQRAQERVRRVARTTGADTASLALWHHTLRRFGAEQLNERYRRRFGSEMESAAWTGWIAMKMLAEAALRGRSTTPLDLARYLSRPATRFDGHKGQPLTFDAFSGELRQPMYLIASPTPGDTITPVAVEVAQDAIFGLAGTSQPDRVCDGADSSRRAP